MRKEPFINEEIYHIYNRGNDKRRIFFDYFDYKKLFLELYVYNNQNDYPIPLSRVTEIDITQINKNKKPLVEILHWAFMPNHFHLLLKQKTKNGISKFIQRVCTGYTMYFNARYEHSGRIFQGAFKSKYVACDDYFVKLSSYIPLNPLSLIFPQWPEVGIPKNQQNKAEKFIFNYRWSSLREYFNETADIKLSEPHSFLEIFDGPPDEYREYIKSVLLTN